MAGATDGVTDATRADLELATRNAFVPSPVRKIGAEVEWLVIARDDPYRPVTAAQTARAAEGDLPARGAVTIEPGGQLELVTRPFAEPDALIAAMERDTAELVARFDRAELALVALGVDPLRPPVRSLDVERYRAMETYFAARTPAGRSMMTRTASFQINIDVGTDPAAAWRRAHALAPFFAATFANSPIDEPDDTASAASRRLQIWRATDPSRTALVGPTTEAWTRFALDAQVMFRTDPATGEETAQLEPLTMADWLRSPTPPSTTELTWHLRSLFPPVRPRRWLELRMIDAVDAAGRAAAIAAAWALLTDDTAGDDAAARSLVIDDAWDRAVEHGVDDEAIADMCDDTLDAAVHALASAPTLQDQCRTWAARDRRSIRHATAIDLIEEHCERR